MKRERLETTRSAEILDDSSEIETKAAIRMIFRLENPAQIIRNIRDRLKSDEFPIPKALKKSSETGRSKRKG
jgi:hypothetical protein